MNDEELFLAFARGDERAFEKLHAKYAKALGRYVKVKTNGDSLVCDEIVQSVFIKLVRYKDDFDASRRFCPWLYTIADRLCRDWTKSDTRRAKYIRSFSDYDGDGKSLSIPNDHEGAIRADLMHDSKTKTPDDAMEDEELGRKAMSLLRALPPNLRNTVQMSVLKGVPTRAAGPLLQISHSQVQNRLRAAMDILRKQMASEPTDSIEVEHVDLEVGTMRDLVEMLPQGEYESIERVMFDDGVAQSADYGVFAKFVRRLVGEAV